MVYFFHHYELPAVEQQARVHSLIAFAQRQQTPQHLLTVMTRTAAGDLARTTADISRLTPTADTPDITDTHTTTCQLQADNMALTSPASESDHVVCDEDAAAQSHQLTDTPSLSSDSMVNTVDSMLRPSCVDTHDCDNALIRGHS